MGSVSQAGSEIEGGVQLGALGGTELLLLLVSEGTDEIDDGTVSIDAVLETLALEEDSTGIVELGGEKMLEEMVLVLGVPELEVDSGLDVGAELELGIELDVSSELDGCPELAEDTMLGNTEALEVGTNDPEELEAGAKLEVVALLETLRLGTAELVVELALMEDILEVLGTPDEAVVGVAELLGELALREDEDGAFAVADNGQAIS